MHLQWGGADLPSDTELPPLPRVECKVNKNTDSLQREGCRLSGDDADQAVKCRVNPSAANGDAEASLVNCKGENAEVTLDNITSVVRNVESYCISC